MKITYKLTLLCILVNSFTCLSQNTSKTFLANYVDSIKTQYALNEDPMILFDGVSITYENRQSGWFSILKEEVHEIKYIKKGESDIYGSKGKFGVILLTTKESLLEKLDDYFIHKIKRIYIFDGNVVSKDFIDSFDKKKIRDVKLINEQSKISKYTSEKFDKLVLISTKK